MSALNLAALAVGVLAVILLCAGGTDPWFFGLLSLACLLGSMAEAYKENKSSAIGLLAGAALMAVISLVTAARDSRRSST